VVDAAGAIYVLGGIGGTTRYRDVWVSADGGTRTGLVPGVVGGVLQGVLPGYYKGYCRGSQGYRRGLP
jgi:hypothetical protein